MKNQRMPFVQTIPFLLFLMAWVALPIGCSNAQANSGGWEVAEIQTSAVCGTCKKTLETALSKVDGVESARLDLGNKVLTIKYDPEKTNPDALRLTISETGYDADEVPAVQTSHDNLPACCQKDSGLH